MAHMEINGLAQTLDLADLYVELFAERAHQGNLLVSPEMFQSALAGQANSRIGSKATVQGFAAAMDSGIPMAMPAVAEPEPEYYEEEPVKPEPTPYRYGLLAGAIDVPVVSNHPLPASGGPTAISSADGAAVPYGVTMSDGMSPRLIDTLIDNPYQCRAVIAGQRTGKTHGAAVATYSLKQDGTKVYYINLQDHGQNNAAAFAHADKSAIGNLASLGDSRGAIDLVEKAINIVQEFYGEDDAILVIDEWMSLGAETLKVEGIEELWTQIANKATALSSNGIGSGKAIWGLAPFFKATSLRKDARTLKLFAPLVLSIAPGQSVPWSNPKNGKTTQITLNAQVIGDVCTNWQNAIEPPSDGQSRQWKRDGSDRIYWWNGEWNPVGELPSLPTTEPSQPTNNAVKGNRPYLLQLIKDLKTSNLTAPQKAALLEQGKQIEAHKGEGAVIAFLEQSLGI
jgi:hypothetical protein